MMQLKNYSRKWKQTAVALLLPSLILTSGCAGLKPEKEVVIQTEYLERKIPVQPRPKGLKLNPLNFYAVTEENLQEFLERFEKENGDIVFFALSVPGYENLSMNMAELRRFIDQQKQIIIYYETSVMKSPRPPRQELEFEE